MRALNRLFLGAYSGLWRAAGPLLRRHKRLKEDFARRLVPDDWLTAERHVAAGASVPGPNSVKDRPLRIWVQAASGGEAWLVHSLAPALAEALAAHPTLSARPLELLCTTWTRQGLDILEKLPAPARASAPVSILPRYFPLDRPDLMRRAIDAAKPDAVALLETELWPGLLAAAAEKGIPILALNARMTEKSFKAYGKAGFFWRDHAPERILAISPEDADRFARLFGCPERVELMPNIKFDRVAGGSEPPAGNEEPAAFRAEAGIGNDVLLVVLGSVREEEEALLLPVVSALHGLSLDGHPVAVAVAPRHLHRVDAWKARLMEAALPFCPRSAQGGIGDEEPGACLSAAPPVYLWDTFGELHALYAIADAVYVGGSLVPLGGQNFLEPLSQGVTPLVGPHIDNFLWIGEELFDEGLVTRLSEAADLRTSLESELYLRLDALTRADDGQSATESGWRAARSTEAARIRERFAAWLGPRRGGSRQAAEALAQALAKK